MVAKQTVTLARVFENLRESLDLELLTSMPEHDVVLEAPDVHRPGMALMGFMANFLPGRLQVLGESERAYLISLDASGQAAALHRLRELEAPAIFLTRGQEVPEASLAVAREAGFPIFRTSRPTEEFIRALGDHLAELFAPSDEIHATLVDVYGVGLLVTGDSGVGKSECALDLVERGHRLVADDIVEIRRIGEDVVLGTFREVLQHSIEIRGVGVIDVQAVFGIRGIRMQKRIEVEVNLQPGGTTPTTNAWDWTVATPSTSACASPRSKCRFSRARTSRSSPRSSPWTSCSRSTASMRLRT